MKISRTAILASLLLNHLPAHATSFDCNKGRSLAEQLICHQPDLSSLDDQLGKLYWKARRSVANPKAFRVDSDSKWAWREANCTDEACLKTWYTGRIEELQNLLANLPPGAPAQPDQPAGRLPQITRDPERRALAQVAPLDSPLDVDKTDKTDKADNPANPDTAIALQCTAADPGIALHDQCATVLKEDAHWQYQPHGGDWFCGVASVTQSPERPVAEQ